MLIGSGSMILNIWAKPHISLTVPNSFNLTNLWHLLTKNTEITQNILKNTTLKEDTQFVGSQISLLFLTSKYHEYQSYTYLELAFNFLL